ncbi:DEAD/DEAH box helicase [Cohnella yongneupensis]|uniref:DEAD/DEAH box helicase n=1 Tax=Cohnella yongneupensis TaxID=425006 RepID=A0ABW0QVR4_9BACL
MSVYGSAIQVRVELQPNGDAYLTGSIAHYDLSGLTVKHRLFARHEASFYGTQLEVVTVDGESYVVLPAEQVIGYFAATERLRHIEWAWDADGEWLVQRSPLLYEAIENRRYEPSFEAFRGGKLAWAWNAGGWEEDQAEQLKGALSELAELPEQSRIGIAAAFSAAVFDRWYGSKETASDLRREYPALFARGDGLAGMTANEWLIAVGWKADSAPFRPALRLSEPVDPMDAGDAAVVGWRLDFVLQDKQDVARIVEVVLSGEGRAEGRWPAEWTEEIAARAPGWLARLRALLPRYPFAAGMDALAAPLGDADAWRFLAEDSRRLLDAGWNVWLPAWWEAARKKKPRVRAKLEGGTNAGQSLFGLDTLLSFDWRIAIGDAELSEEEFASLVARGERLVRFRGQWLALDPALLEQIRRTMALVDRKSGLSFQDVLQLHLLGEADNAERADGQDGASEADRHAAEEAVRLEVELGGHLLSLVNQIGRHNDWPALPVPASLKAELRSYQREGYSWLAFLRRFGLGACLADDMGLGKTVQFIAYLLRVKEASDGEDQPGTGPALLVCPTSVLGNWQKELRRFAPSLRVMLHYGGRRAQGEGFLKEAGQVDVVLTSYAIASLDQETLAETVWSSLCLDEAQNIKNAHTKQSVAVRSLRALHRIALTGTPIENRLSELWSIYDFITPGYLGTQRGFQQRFGQAVEKARDEARTADLRKLVQPFLLRRKKKDPSIQLDLPEKNEMKTYVHLTAEQGVLYDQAVNRLMERMNALEGIERKGAILAALTQLKQICDHPLLATKEDLPLDDASSEAWEAIVARSSKLERLVAMVKELREEGDRCLIFTQYVGMGRMLQTVLGRELGEEILYLSGSSSKTARDRMIERFQAPGDAGAEAPPGVFVLSLKAGGVGLNLTAASHVFHFDRWWNPAVENQATDRAYRMGQTRDVQVHKFISLGTLEEKIDEMLESKQQLSDNVVASSSEGWITELSTEALQDLFTLRRDLLIG